MIATTTVASKNVTAIDSRESRITVALAMNALSMARAPFRTWNRDSAIESGIAEVTIALTLVAHTTTGTSIGASHSMTTIRAGETLHAQALSIQADTTIAAVAGAGDFYITDFAFIARKAVALSKAAHSVVRTVILATEELGAAVGSRESRFAETAIVVADTVLATFIRADCGSATRWASKRRCTVTDTMHTDTAVRAVIRTSHLHRAVIRSPSRVAEALLAMANTVFCAIVWARENDFTTSSTISS